jgi:phosphocarrier protein
VSEADAGARSRVLTIRNQKGLHARAAAKFVKCAERFACEVTVARQDMAVSGRSILGLMMLGAVLGSEIEVQASGPDAATALAALAELVEGRFEEGE